ncbi:MAG: glycosyltransferase family 2 protein, partial [Chloroflexi bacterium]|nr:glycosyltransferase family 2 protein [Chloroflexota bacterium]
LTPGREFWRLLFLDRILPRATYPMHRWPTSGAREVAVIKGACLVLRHSALDQVGLLDERYFMYTEEMDLCLRLALAGWRLHWVPEARVVHLGAASTRQAAEAMYLALYRSKVQFQRKFWGQWRARRLKVLVGVAYVPRWAAASVGRFAGRSLAARAHIYRRLLAELPSM